MSDVGMGSQVKATLSIDTDSIEEVHARLIRKGTQNGMRAQVIDGVRGLLESLPVDEETGSSILSSSDRFKLGLLLNSDCDTV